MSSLKPCAALAAACVLLLIQTNAFANINYLSQSRSVSANASADNFYTGANDSDSENHSAPDFGAFSQGASASASLSSAFSSAGGTQNSTLSPTQILAFGTCGMSADAYGFEEESSCGGNSNFSVTFELNDSADYTFTGTIAAFDNGSADIQFDGPSGTIYQDSAFGYFQPFSLNGTLDPGTYTLSVNTSGGAYASGFSDYASGEYDLNLEITTTTSTPGALTDPSLSLAPNPVFDGRTTVSYALPLASDASVAVYDLRGRLVADLHRGFQSEGAHTLVWNGRDMLGNRAPVGVYLVRVDSQGFQSTEKLVLAR